MIWALLGMAFAADPLATYNSAVAADTAALTAALPRFALCERPATRLLVKLTYTGATVAAIGKDGPTKVEAPCIVKTAVAALTTRPPVGHEVAFGLTFAGSRASLQGDVVLFGLLENEAIEAGVRAHIDAVAACYLDELAKVPGLKGQVTMEFTVLPTGLVYDPVVKNTTLLNPAAEKCMVEVVRKLQFVPPDGGGIVRVTYPFTFNPPE